MRRRARLYHDHADLRVPGRGHTQVQALLLVEEQGALRPLEDDARAARGRDQHRIAAERLPLDAVEGARIEDRRVLAGNPCEPQAPMMTSCVGGLDQDVRLASGE